MKYLVSLIICLAIVTASFAQEHLAPLRSNAALQKEFDEAIHQVTPGLRAGENNQYIYLFDTLSLPFVDDFTSDRRKNYRFDKNDPNVSSTPIYGFRIGTDYPEVFNAMYDTSYNYQYNSSTNQWDSTQNPVTFIELLDPITQIPSDTDTVWIVPNGRIVADTLDTNVTPDFIYVNTFDTIFVIPSDGPDIYWKSRSAFVNNSYGILPPSYGVATFDGLDSLGRPYRQLSSSSSYGIADVFTSAPIDVLNKPVGGGIYTVADSIYLSFFYQPQGRGESPEEKDSLVLEFYDVDQKVWNHVWSTSGDGNGTDSQVGGTTSNGSRPFKQAFVKFEQGKYFRDGFQFRFKNYATLNGAFDHWNVDYVRILPNELNTPNSTLDDVAFTEHPVGLLKEYTQMPWTHFKVNPDAHMADTAQSVAINNFNANKNVRFGVEVYEQGTKVFNTDFSQNTEPQFPSESSIDKRIDIQPFVFSDTSNAKRYTFDVRHVLNTTPDVNRENDTLHYSQDFGSFYSYDDGIAENAYYVVSAGAQIAVEYTIAVEDTLRAINIYFPESGEDVSGRLFRFKVWSSLNPETILYESPLHNPVYSFYRDVVQRYEIDPLVVSGKIYIGIEQLLDPVIIGFDRNFNSRFKTFYAVNNVWSLASFEGSVMMHPEFDTTYFPWPVSVPEVAESENFEVNIFPNPANDQVTVVWNELDDVHVQIFDLQGRLMVAQQAFGEQIQMPVQDLSNGIYIVQVVSLTNQRTSTKRLMIR